MSHRTTHLSSQLGGGVREEYPIQLLFWTFSKKSSVKNK